MQDPGRLMTDKPVAIVMGSQSDWATLPHAAETLDALGVSYEARMSAHRMRRVPITYRLRRQWY
jgi:phosphoribosylcarboxyaminoimidazole (NCAIR) mutase